MTLAFLQIGLNLVVSIVGIELLQRRFRFSQEQPAEWQAEWSRSADSDSSWPYTPTIQCIGKIFHRVKAALPILAAACLIARLWVPQQ